MKYLLCLGVLLLMGSSAPAQDFPYPSMFEANNAWRGRIRYHESPWGGVRYVRRWGNGLTPQGAAFGTSLVNGAVAVLGNGVLGNMLGAPEPSSAPQLAEPETYLEEITTVAEAVAKENEDLKKQVNELAKKFGVEEVTFPEVKKLEPLQGGGGNAAEPGPLQPPSPAPSAPSNPIQ